MNEPKLQPQLPTVADRDVEATSAIKAETNQLVPWYLMASYLYYHENFSLLTDGCYDEICKMLHKDWDKLTHRHLSVIDKASLSAGTGYTITKDQYPGIAKSAAINLMREMQGLPSQYDISQWLVPTGPKLLEAPKP